MSQPLTARQKECLIFIVAHVKAHGVSPSYAEIATGLGLKAKGRAFYLVKLLAAKGYVRVHGGNWRRIEVLPSENHHAADCLCARCAHSRYLKGLQLIHALEVPAPAWMRSANLTNFKPLSNLTRTSWRIGFPYHPDERAKPRVKVVQ